MKVVRIPQRPGVDPRTSKSLLAWLPRVDAIVVIGSPQHVDLRDVIRYCHQQLTPALQITTAEELESAWFDDVDSVGLLAFPATPIKSIDQIQRKLQTMGRASNKESISC